MNASPAAAQGRPTIQRMRGRVPGSPRAAIREAATLPSIPREVAPALRLVIDLAGAPGVLAESVERWGAGAQEQPETEALIRGKLRSWLRMDQTACRSCRKRGGAPRPFIVEPRPRQGRSAARRWRAGVRLVGTFGRLWGRRRQLVLPLWERQPCAECGARGIDHQERATRAVERVARCGQRVTVLSERGRPERRYLLPAPCESRACAVCAPRRLGRIVQGRWAPLFEVGLKPGFVLEMFTLGNAAGHIGTRAAVRDYIRRLARAMKVLRRGAARCGIAPGALVAGLRVVEIVPKRSGGWVHAHLVIVRRIADRADRGTARDPFPYGLSQREHDKRAALGHFDARTRGFTNYRYRPAPHELGIREVLRRHGIGEVGRHDILSTGGAAEKAGAYLKKLESYLKKVDGKPGEAREAGYLFGGRVDILRMLSGVRMVDAFGALRGALAGPDRIVRTVGGVVAGRLERRGILDPLDPETWGVAPVVYEAGGTGRVLLGQLEGIEHGAELTVTRETHYRDDTIESWRAWADVDRLWAGMLDGRPRRPEPRGNDAPGSRQDGAGTRQRRRRDGAATRNRARPGRA